MEKNLKEVPANKQKSLGKLPTDVRNKMGYAKKGTMMKAKKGVLAEEDKYAKQVREMKLGAKQGKGTSRLSKDVKKKNMGGEMKSTQGYGAARTSGMGLQDESLPLDKSLDYYKDIM